MFGTNFLKVLFETKEIFYRLKPNIKPGAIYDCYEGQMPKVFIHLLLDVLRPLKNVSLVLQNSTITLADVHSKVHGFKQKLEIENLKKEIQNHSGKHCNQRNIDRICMI